MPGIWPCMYRVLQMGYCVCVVMQVSLELVYVQRQKIDHGRANGRRQGPKRRLVKYGKVRYAKIR